MAPQPISDKFSQASISAAADALVANPDEYFRRCRERQTIAARRDVADFLDAAMRDWERRHPSILTRLLRLVNGRHRA